MLKRSRAGVLALAIGATACAIHPLPDDVTHLPTNLIVRKIRCEAREAIKDSLLQYLKVSTPEDRKIATGIENHTLPLRTVSDSLFSGDTKAIVQKFENAGIAYDFTFDITDTDNLDPSLDLIDKFSHHGNISSSIGGNFDRARQSIRNFTIHDTFIKLITLEGKDPKIYCPNVIREPNYSYPIAGNIGLGESLHQFVTMALFDNLGAKESSGPATMVDRLVFTTKLSLNATPKIMLTPVGNGFHLLDFLLGITASRNDIHTLNVAFALPNPPPTTPPAQPSAAPLAPTLSPFAAQRAPLVLPTQLPRQVVSTRVRSGLFINATGTSAELLAAEALDQAILRYEVGRAGAVIVPAP